MTRCDPARWQNSIPAGGVAHGGLLIPVSTSELGVVCGGVEQNDENGVRHVVVRSVKHAVRVDDF